MFRFLRRLFDRLNPFKSRHKRITMTREQKELKESGAISNFFDCPSCEAVNGAFETEHDTLCLYCDTGK